MNKAFGRFGSVLLLSLLCVLQGAPALAQENGNWQLVRRVLPDGTVQVPPAVHGYSSIKNGVYQLLVAWLTPEGKQASISQVSRWEWTESQVSATSIFFMLDDGSGKAPLYVHGGERKSVPLKREGGRVSYQHPLNMPYIVRDGDRSTATVEGQFTDHWERVR